MKNVSISKDSEMTIMTERERIDEHEFLRLLVIIVSKWLHFTPVLKRANRAMKKIMRGTYHFFQKYYSVICKAQRRKERGKVIEKFSRKKN